jgi:hypothetical protein
MKKEEAKQGQQVQITSVGVKRTDYYEFFGQNDE